MLVIPLKPIPNQTLTVSLADQICQINVYQKAYGLFVDLYSNNVLVLGGQLCQNLNRIVRSAYLGFQGDIAFFDNQGSEDPVYTGLGTRWTLMYLEVADLQGN